MNVLDELRFWTMTCGCHKPSIHYSSDFEARVCSNCGVIVSTNFKDDEAPSDDHITLDNFGSLSQKLVDEKSTDKKVDWENTFVHLRVHTHNSLLKATCKHKDLIAKAKEYGMPALAKTEFGNMCGVPTFVKDCVSEGIKPIVGIEFDVLFTSLSDDHDHNMHPVTFIAMNREGYKNLVRLTTTAWCERKNKKHGVHITNEDIVLTHDLIAIVDIKPNPHIAELVLTTLNNKLETYIEINTEKDDEYVLVKSLQEKHSLPVVVTGNVLYTNEEEKDSYGVGLKIGKHAETHHVSDDIDNWFKPPVYYGSLFEHDQEWTNAAVNIAKRIEDYGIINKDPIIPTFKEGTKEYTDLEEAHRKLEMECWRGLYEKGKASDPIYSARLQRELDMMKEKNFSSYHLLIGEIISWMKKQGIMKPFGRGSSVGSLVCYTLDIIAMDPIQWGVPFERYINSGRIDLPDIDTDISQERRGEVLSHIADLHGHDRVAHIATFQTLKLRAAIDNAGKVLQVPFAVNKDLRKEIPDDVVDWDDLNPDNKLKIKDLMSFKPEWLDISLSLTGSAKNFGYHAAGIVIANQSLSDLVPLLPPEEEGGLLGIQYDMYDCEVLGLLKLDMLGLRNIDIVQHAVDRIEEKHGNKINVYDLPFDDDGTYETISKAEYVSVFQLDSTGYRRLCRQLRPDNFHHLMALNALFRPGPLEGGMTDEFVERKHGRQELIGWHPWLDEVLSTTYQVPVYQEQVMAIAKIIAGFDDVQADKYRKAIGKKDKVKFDQAQKQFKAGALNQPGLTPPLGWSGNLEEWIDDLLVKLAGYARYGWNIGHSCGYGRLTYITAYLETHYPYEYYAAVLDAYADNKNKLPVLLRAVLSTKVRIAPPSVNESKILYEVGSDNSIYMGLGAVRNVGKAASGIIEERDNGKFTSFINFCQRLPKVNKLAKISLVKSGAFRWDKMLCDRDKIDNIDVIQKWVKKKNKTYDGSKVSAIEIAMKLEMIQGNEYSDLERSILERESLNSFITGHPANIYQSLSPYLERGGVRVITPSQVNPDEISIGDTVLLVGMVDHMNRKMTKGSERYKSKPYLNLSISDTQTHVVANIWSPLCEDLEKVIIAGEIAMLECVIKPDRYRDDAFMLKVDTAISLANGLPIQGVFRVNGHDPGDVVSQIGGTVNQTSRMGNRNFSSIRGRITVKPHILDGIVKKCGNDIKYLVSMDALEV